MSLSTRCMRHLSSVVPEIIVDNILIKDKMREKERNGRKVSGEPDKWERTGTREEESDEREE